MKSGAVALLVLAALPCLARDSHAQAPTFPSHEVHIDVAVDEEGAATVREEYALAGSADATFEFLEHPCSAVGPVSASVDGRIVPSSIDPDARRPWTGVRLSRLGVGDGPSVCLLNYHVRTMGSEALVPIVLPAATLARADGSPGADVTLDVTFASASSESRVVMPQLQRTTPGNRWQGRFLAIPSIVRIQLSSARETSCDQSVAGATGGLEWRFAIFVATMVLWVPMYLWWFGRTR